MRGWLGAWVVMERVRGMVMDDGWEEMMEMYRGDWGGGGR